MSVLHSYFDYKCNQSSPVREDYVRVVNYDAEGKEFITYEKFDYPAYQKSLGDANLWSLDSLVKAGIDPNFNIHTGLCTRLDGIESLRSVEVFADKILAENNDSK